MIIWHEFEYINGTCKYHFNKKVSFHTLFPRNIFNVFFAFSFFKRFLIFYFMKNLFLFPITYIVSYIYSVYQVREGANAKRHVLSVPIHSKLAIRLQVKHLGTNMKLKIPSIAKPKGAYTIGLVQALIVKTTRKMNLLEEVKEDSKAAIQSIVTILRLIIYQNNLENIMTSHN